MILEDRLTDSDRIILEKIFWVENIILEKVRPRKTKILRKLAYIGLLIFFILSIWLYCLGNNILFIICEIIIFLYLILCIAYIYLKQKFEKNLIK